MTIKARCQIMFTKAQELFCKQNGIIMITDFIYSQVTCTTYYY